MNLISLHGEYWHRDPQNFRILKSKYKNPKGIYALFNGQMPVYFGKGKICSRLRKHHRSGSKTGYWDHFSWYEIEGDRNQRDIETLLLRILPVYLHILNRQRGNFCDSSKAQPALHVIVALKRPKYGFRRKSRRKRK